MAFRGAISLGVCLASLVSCSVVADDSRPFEPAIRLDAGTGWAETSGGGVASSEAFPMTGAFSLAVAGDGFAFQGDFDLRHDDFDVSTVTRWTLGGHAGWRDPAIGMAGVSAAYGEIDVTNFPGDQKNVRVGGEGELFLNRLTLGAAAGYANIEVSGFGLPPVDGTYVKGLARLYLDDGLRLEGSLGTIDTEGPGSLVYAHVDGDYQWGDSAWSVYARWNHQTVHVPGPDTYVNHFLTGVRFYFGGGARSLKDRDRVHFADTCLFPSISGVC